MVNAVSAGRMNADNGDVLHRVLKVRLNRLYIITVKGIITGFGYFVIIDDAIRIFAG